MTTPGAEWIGQLRSRRRRAGRTGDARLTVVAAAVYAALKLCGDTSTARRYLTQAQVVEAVSPIVDLSTNKIERYNRKLVDAFEARYGTRDPAVVLERDASAD